jgi:hypothetical protein
MNAVQERIWKTKDGREIPVEKMTRRHLINAYLMCRRNGYVSPATLEFYLNTAGPTADMASYYFEQEQNQVFDSPVLVSMGYLEDELERRKINRYDL